jgi:hypothetical protein
MRKYVPSDYIFIGIAVVCLVAAIALRLATGLEVTVFLLQRAVAPLLFVCGIAWLAKKVMERRDEQIPE